ncbi:hypothetical protein INR49_028119 [Caranx melampygus]|nr:hypothetical protein INR49_028119 [Caranx melampygus]
MGGESTGLYKERSREWSVPLLPLLRACEPRGNTAEMSACEFESVEKSLEAHRRSPSSPRSDASYTGKETKKLDLPACAVEAASERTLS